MAAYREQIAVVQRMMKRDKQQAIEDHCKQMEEKSVTNSSRDLYKVIKTLIGNFKPIIDALKDEKGLCTD